MAGEQSLTWDGTANGQPVPSGNYLLGVRAQQAGRHQEAVDLIQRALAARGPDAIIHSNLAAAYLGMGLFAEAEAHCRAALKLRPDFADAFSNLGQSLRGQWRTGPQLRLGAIGGRAAHSRWRVGLS